MSMNTLLDSYWVVGVIIVSLVWALVDEVRENTRLVKVIHALKDEIHSLEARIFWK